VKSLREIFGFQPKCSSKDPVDSKGWFDKGYALMCKGGFEEASTCFERVLQVEPDNLEALNNRGVCLLASGKPAKALEDIDRALKECPDNARYWYNKGVCHLRKSENSAAIESFSKATSLFPEYSEAWFNLAAAMENAGLRDAAASTLHRYLSAASKDREQRQWIKKAKEKLLELERE
jgi:tetratricopeptide (TPR) repeat protein